MAGTLSAPVTTSWILAGASAIKYDTASMESIADGVFQIQSASSKLYVDGFFRRPSQARLDEARAAALSVANDIRREMGLAALDDLRPGFRARALGCVISATVVADSPHVEADTGTQSTRWRRARRRFGLNLGWESGAMPLPAMARKFVEWFDAGYYPDLTLSASRTTG